MSNTDTDPRVLTLLTDFGIEDTFVGVMKGVIAGIAPDARIVDLSHSVPPQDVRTAAFLIGRAAPFFPDGTVHAIVVDPGVGSERHVIAARTKHATYVAPDNGVLTMVLRQDPPITTVRLENREYCLPRISTTFHGRDIFAPVAAHLASGVPLKKLGPPIDDLATIEIPVAHLQPDGRITGHIRHIDHFGNCITDIPAGMLPVDQEPSFDVGNAKNVRFHCTYAAVQPGETLALIESSDFIEIAIRDGNAAKVLGATIGDPVLCHPQK